MQFFPAASFAVEGVTIRSYALDREAIRALPSDAVELVPSVNGVAYLILWCRIWHPLWSALDSNYGNINASCNIQVFGYPQMTAVNEDWNGDVTDLLHTGAFFIHFAPVVAALTALSGGGAESSPVSLVVNNFGDGDFTGGNEDNELKVEIAYREYS